MDYRMMVGSGGCDGVSVTVMDRHRASTGLGISHSTARRLVLVLCTRGGDYQPAGENYYHKVLRRAIICKDLHVS